LGTPCPGSSSFPPATAETRCLSRELARISKWSFPWFPSSSLGTGSGKLELLHSCVPKLELGNKKQKICTQRELPLVPKLWAWERSYGNRSWSFCAVVFPSWSLGTRRNHRPESRMREIYTYGSQRRGTRQRALPTPIFGLYRYEGRRRSWRTRRP
jgi:hypothetical protein